MRTTKELLEQYSEKEIKSKEEMVTVSDAQQAMIQFAKEALEQCQKMFWEHTNKVTVFGGKMKTYSEISLELMKKLE